MSDERAVLASARFDVRQADVTAAIRAGVRWQFKRPSAYVLPLTISILSTSAIAITERISAPLVLGGAFLGAWGGMVVCVAIIYLAAPLLARRTIRVHKELRHEWRVDLSRDGIRAVTPNQDAFRAWADYVAWAEDGRVILVYQSTRIFQYLPKRALSAEFLAIFHELIAGVPRR